MDALATIYDRPDLLDGDRERALGRHCPSAQECWGDHEDPHRDSGSIFLPWVGAGYEPEGVCVVGLNLRIGEGQGTYWGIERKVVADQLSALLAGRKKSRGSRWASSTMRDAALTLRSLRDEDLAPQTTADELASALNDTARVQTVKCSPGAGRGAPFPAMAAKCPTHFLSRELNVLRPGVLLIYGRTAARAIRGLGAERDVQRLGERFRRIGLDFPGWSCTAFVLTHPAHGGWSRDHALLRDVLGREPLADS